jgi:CHAD domain-containing protein
MAFRLRLTESVPDGLRRLAKNELGSISKHLHGATHPRDDAIHEARKSVKKVRAILEVVDGDRGRGLGKSSKRLQAISRRLSALRDADAMLEILQKLRSHDGHALSPRTFARVSRRLTAHKQSLRKAVNRKSTWRHLDQSVRKIRRSVRQWEPAHGQFGALAAGIRLSHRRGRKAMARARQRQGADDFHEWRKQMKALWYELRLVEDASPRIRRDVIALHRAESWLGDEHNMVVLCEELSKDGSICDGRVDLDRMRLAADRYQCELREKALARAKRIYARGSREYAEIIGRAWKTAHSSQREDQ